MADREIGVGVVGFGLGGRVFHAPFVNAVTGLRLAAILQRKGDEAAKAFPGARIVRSLDDLLADKTIELVVVTTPNATHFALAKQALEAGKHVVIDKPFTATSEQASTLGQLAKSKGLLAIPFHNRRWDGDFLTVKKLIAEQALGRLVTFESHFDRFRPAPREGHGRRRRTRPTECSSTSGRTWSIRRSRSSAAGLDHGERPLGSRRDGDRGRLRHHAALSGGERQRPAGALPDELSGLRQFPEVLAARDKRELPQARPRSAGACAGRRRETSQAGIAGRVAAGGRVGVGHADASRPIRPLRRRWSRAG
jgi:hypothetical protein